MIRILSILLWCFCALEASGQSKKKKRTSTLLTIAGKEVSPEEFIYLFKKNHSTQSGSFSRRETEDYLDLFIRFKLKVEEARTRGLDTTQAFISEYKGYRDELLKPYLPNTRITDSLVQLTYDRLTYEVRASHILVSVKPGAPPEDTLTAYERAHQTLLKIREGEDFDELAKTTSDDPSARTNYGNIGYFTALQMVYPFESAAYSTAIGAVTGPVRTAFGYHVIKVTDKRPSRGEVEVSHIMIRGGNGQTDDENRDLIFEIHDKLRAGVSWEALCAEYSQDQTSREKSGKLRPFGVRAMGSAPPFEDMAFALQVPGEYSDPFQTPFGWHIVRLDRKIPLPPLETVKAQLQAQVAKDERFTIARDVWMGKLKKQMGLTENASSIKLLRDACEAGNCLAVGAESMANVLFQLQEKVYDIRGFTRFSHQKGTDLSGASLAAAIDDYEIAVLMDHFEKLVSDQNSTFLMLSREYYEGILLFEIMEEEVWNRAAADTVGQRLYYAENAEKYTASERVEATFYASEDSSFRAPLKALLMNRDSVQIWQKVERDDLSVEKGIFEKSDHPALAKVPWEAGMFELEDNGKYYLATLERILAAGKKSFEEARAAIVADYQQKLESEWIEQLRLKYPVKVNEKGRQYVFEQLGVK